LRGTRSNRLRASQDFWIFVKRGESKTLPTTEVQTLEEVCINTIRFLSADAVQNANSGHPGLPMGAAAMAYTLWTKVPEV
jgi:hypothetical protein